MDARKKRLRWLVIALLLLALATAIMWTGDDIATTKTAVEFPTHLREREQKRRETRARDLSLLVTHMSKLQRKNQREDPLTVALSGAAERGFHMVFELKELLDTPIGEIITGCLEDLENSPFDAPDGETGFPPLSAIDRIAVADGLVLIEGDFAAGAPGILTKDLSGTADGDAVRYAPESDTDVTAPNMALWKESLFMFGRDTSAVNEALGLLRGEIPFDPETISTEDAYGAIYGQIEVAQAAELFEGEGDFQKRFTELAETVAVHVDASEDVAMAASVKGWESGPEMKDLAKSLGGILSLARLKARTEGEEELSALLDFASVKSNDAGFDLEVALPLSFLEENLKDCAWAKGFEAPPDRDDTEPP